MKKNNKIIIYYLSFILGLSLIIFSWIKSYPISITDYQDFTIQHIYPFFFIGLSLALISLFFITLNTKKKVNRVFCIFGFVLLFYSINFFYPLLPGPDSQYFMGLTKYFIETNNPNFNANSYFQWPGLFIFAKFISFITGIKDINTIAIIIFLLVGFTLSFTFYFIFRKQSKKYAPILAVIYFLIMFYFINYQYAAQSLAIAILFLLIVLTLNKEKNNRLWMIVLFCALVITHAFMATFFIFYLVAYLFFSKIFKKNEKNKNISWIIVIVCLAMYLCYLNFVAVDLRNDLGDVIKNSALGDKNINFNIFTRYTGLAVHRPITYTEYLEPQKEAPELTGLSILESSNVPSQQVIINTNDNNLFWININNYSQIISRTLIISLIVLLIIGFIILFFQKKIEIEILSIGVAGFIYMAFGTLINILGERGLQLLTIPICVGAIFFLDNKNLRKIFLIYFIILLLIFPLVIIHSNFDNQLYQEYHEKVAGDFFIGFINNIKSEQKIQSHFFIFGRHDMALYTFGSLDLSNYKWKNVDTERYILSLSSLRRNKYDYIFYSNNLKKSLIKKFRSPPQIITEISKGYEKDYNKVYNNKGTSIYSIKFLY